MYNFYQSTIRKTINKDITHKPVGDISLFWKEYQYIIWEKKKRWISMNRIQILWIENITWYTYKQWQWELVTLIKKHNPIFIQLWSIDILSSYTRDELKNENILSQAKKTYYKMIDNMKQLWFQPSIKENLPPSTYIIDLFSDWGKNMSGQHTTKIKKARKNSITISQATTQDFDIAYNLLKKTGQGKGFWVVSQKSYNDIANYFTKNNTWTIYVAKIDSKIVAMAMYVKDYVNKTAIYLYGWTDRSFSNRWASHLLHIEAYKMLQKEWFQTIDLLGWWPTWFPKHKLSSVSVFKEWFGWQKIDYIWSYDIVYKPIIYKIRTIMRSLFH